MSVNEPPSLKSGIADVWVASVADWAGRPEYTRLLECLSEEESERRSRFVFERDKVVYGLAHGMVRHLLSQIAGRRPNSWQFTTNAYGRPELAPGQTTEAIRFNLSHTTELAACVLTRNSDVGIDVESIGRPIADITSIAQSLSLSEQEYLSACSESDRRRRFVTIWTLKEAYVKATGRGLSVPLDSFTVRLDSGEPLIEPDGDSCRAAVIEEAASHVISVVIRTKTDERAWWRRHSFLPEGWELWEPVEV